MSVETQVTSESAQEDLALTANNVGMFGSSQLDRLRDAFTQRLEVAQNINPDVKAWLHIESLGIDQPVVVAVDNEQYVRQSLDGGYSDAGTLFFDQGFESFDDANVIIYGHNMSNGSMFAPINDLATQEDASKCLAILTTSDGMYMYVPAALYTTENLQGYIVNDPDDEASIQVEDSEFAFDQKITAGSRVLTLSTCDSDDSDSNRRVMQFVRR